MKGSPYPRSYYKCSHAGCNVKKIVERDPKTGEVSSAIAKVGATVPSAACLHRFTSFCPSCHYASHCGILLMQGGHNHTKPNSRPSSGSMNTRGTGRAGRGGRATRGRAGRVSPCTSLRGRAGACIVQDDSMTNLFGIVCNCILNIV